MILSFFIYGFRVGRELSWVSFYMYCTHTTQSTYKEKTQFMKQSKERNNFDSLRNGLMDFSLAETRPCFANTPKRVKNVLE